MNFRILSKLGLFIILVCLLSSSTAIAKSEKRRAVTYELGGGRFGDKLLGYLHAKWLSYKYDLPLYYKPFPYSDQLAMHQIETFWSDGFLKNFKNVKRLEYQQEFDYTNVKHSTLFLIPYFPECLWEHKPGDQYPYFAVDWEDPNFKALLKTVLKPINEKPKWQLPNDRITVAVHVRQGGNFDTDHTRRYAPLKLPPEHFYIAQIGQLYEILNNQPLYIHIFTDYGKPWKMVERFKAYHQDKDIVWNTRTETNNEDLNVLDDFFAMTEFDCLIRSESNYSIVASKIANYKVMIKPVDFHVIDEQVFINKVEVEIAEPGSDPQGRRSITRYQVEM